MLQRLGAAHRAVSAARPLATAASTGFVVMSAGDAAAQLLCAGASRVDMKRNLVSSSYNGAVAPAFYRWYRLMDWAFPGVALRSLIPKVLCSQLVTTGCNNPAYLAWCNILEAWSSNTDAEAMVEWSDVLARTRDQLKRELPNLYGTSMLFWLPVTGINYALVPDHLRILWVSSVSVLWGAFVSYVAHRPPPALACHDDGRVTGEERVL